MLGGYPRLVTEARMTFSMVRCRSVSDESMERKRPSARADEVSLLSLMALNVAARKPRIKHVFDRRVAGLRPAQELGDNKRVTRVDSGYLCSMAVTIINKLCRWCALRSCSSNPLRSNVRPSNTRAI